MASKPLHVLAIEPFYGGSHRRFLDDVVAGSRHQWTLVTGKPVHWKWRMRSSPLQLAEQTRRVLRNGPSPDILFCSDMLDLPQWRGMLREPTILTLPAVAYFHENQWTYPQSSQARFDAHYGYTNLLTAIAADACWFNSRFHQNDFLTASEAFVRRMPDAFNEHDFASLRRKSEVLVPGFSSPEDLSVPLRKVDPPRSREHATPIRIGWVSRWEYDKRPDRFHELLCLLRAEQIEFELVLLGPRPAKENESLKQIRGDFGNRICFDRYASSREEYWQQLSQIDFVVSTADHEFFGIAVCEAIWAGAVPMLPNRLSYPELATADCLYDSLADAVVRLRKILSAEQRDAAWAACREMVEPYQCQYVIAAIDKKLDRLA